MAGKRVSSLGKRGVDGEKKELSLFSLTPPFKPECLYEALRLDDVVVLHFTEYMYLLQITSRAHSVIYGIMLKTPLLASFCKKKMRLNVWYIKLGATNLGRCGQKWEIRITDN